MKRLIRFLLPVAILSVALFSFAQESKKDRFYILQDFSKGLNSHISEFSLPDNQGCIAQNVRFNNQYGSLAKRDTLITYGDTGAAAVMSLHRFYKSDGTTKLIATYSTNVTVGSDSAGTFATINTGLTDGKQWQWVTFKDNAIGGNGYDQPIKYDGKTTTTANTDGARTAGELCAQLGAPYAELNTGTDLDASKWYQYKVAWYDGSTYSYSTARSNPILTGADVHNIYLTDIPIGPTGTTHRYIYRTLDNANQAAAEANTTFYLVKDLADNSTTVLADTVTDGDADADNAPTWATVSAGTNVTPPLGSILAIHKERLFIAGNTTYPSDVYFSDDGNPDYFDPTYFVVVRADDGDEITFLKTFLGLLTVGKTNTIQKFYTDGDTVSDWALSDPYSFIGCPAPYSVAVSPLGIIYLGRRGLYKFDGQRSSLMSDAVTPQILDINQINIEDTAGYYFSNEYHLAYTSESSGSTTNNRVLIYDFIRDAYALDYESINCFVAFDSGTDSGILYSGSSTTDGYVFAHSGNPNSLSARLKSEFSDGTFDDARVYNTETNPIVELAWDCTIDGWLVELQTKNASISDLDSIITYLPDAIIDRPDTDGTWTSSVYYIDANALDKLYWNENLGPYGDITFQVRTGATSEACAAADWSSAFTNPNGSDISDVTANDYLQVRINLSTTNIDYTPYLYLADGFVWRIIYSKLGVDYETSINSIYETGWKNFGVGGYDKLIRRIKVYYEGTTGTLTISYRNDEGDIDHSFDIDLSVEPSVSIDDAYTGEGDIKVYTYFHPANTTDEPSAVGDYWKFKITESGIDSWIIHKIEVEYDIESIYP